VGTKNAPGEFDCYDKAEPDEPMFVLLGRDPSAGETVRLWAQMRHGDPKESAKCAEALACADALDAWAKKLGKVPRVYATLEPHQSPVRAGMSVRLRDFPGPRLGVRRVRASSIPNGHELIADVFYFDGEGVLHETKFPVAWLVAFDQSSCTCDAWHAGGYHDLNCPSYQASFPQAVP